MADTALTFERYEYKYAIKPDVFAAFWRELEPYVMPDRFFQSTVCSIYYDTPDYRLIRASVEGPVFKEKLRLRTYNVPAPDGEAFVELKRKYDGLVYKRRAAMPLNLAEAYLAGEGRPPAENQITREIDYFLRQYELQPAILIAYDRKAYVSRENPNLRLTFDHSIRWREDDLHLSHGDHGTPLMPNGEVLMELKLPGAAPLWLAHLLSKHGIFPRGFSKYGFCYKNNLYLKALAGFEFK